MPRPAICTLVLVLCIYVGAESASGQYAEEGTIQASAAVLNATTTTPGSEIPRAMLEDCHGVAIIPNVLKGSFVVGARRGHGVLFVREPTGDWRAPVFITLTGGNIGWQIGVQSSDIILVFKTARSVQGILSGKLTLGADAAAAAGPVGRQASAGTDGTLQAEIYTYSRSRGLFAGVSLDGSVIRIDQFATGTYYGNAGGVGGATVPASAAALTQSIAAFAGPLRQPSSPVAAVPGAPGASVQGPALLPQPHASEADVLRGQLAQLAPELYELLDEQWKSYLALPSTVFLTGEHPSPAALQEVVQRFDSVATNPQFQQLASRAEFQSVYGMLKHYQQSLSTVSSAIQLPPPPTR